MNYWLEALESSLDEHCPECVLSQAQREAVAGDMAMAHENYGMAFYQPENPAIGEIKQLKRDLADERRKVHCDACKGTGQVVIHGPYHDSISGCGKCRGEGRYLP